ncbi:MAG: hypothetical protein A2651_00145 [Candidatus Yanofskybacteria bacterium RIFCSPHIGHO2_01_FULL_42_12]|uniref:VWFA domain-containing protein n=1 Tax=Candidatus Yanofskybacteria bacterium RIFCSPLOWO2_01_FULL_42_49 TaxID=1802694 RepID=A0A1F8GEZ8_9BACT|nr:MAG: hypothetical protein A2651_00145 [Candidatus Yanofskybacteria bacterium RIFCSPHIGHO2_01_FULL_42_12]OGN23019.1 MAG: hypothetical protein A2918_02715 [Candidatus Yanofskybacteria bacterium RIFCSPLOWO2_01_FULL_42_49]
MYFIGRFLGNFTFSEPLYLWALLLIAPIFFLWLLIVVLGLFSRPEQTYGSKYPIIGKIKLWGVFALASTILMVIALARPAVSGSEIKPTNGDVQVIVLFDNSFSMKADDIKPSRLEIARREILSIDSFMREGDRVGLFIFGKESHIKLNLTSDFGTFFDQVSRAGLSGSLSDETIFDTDFATAFEHIYQSLDRQDAFLEGKEYNQRYNPKKRTNRIVLVFSDGEDQFFNSKPKNEAEAKLRADYVKKYDKVMAEYKKRGLKIYPVGIGTRTGVSWLFLLKGYKKGTYPPELDKEWIGQVTRLDRDRLSSLAKTTGADLLGYDWTVENSQGNARQYLGHVLDSNRRPLFEFVAGDNDRQFWQYCLLAAIGFLALGIVTYPFQGYLRNE